MIKRFAKGKRKRGSPSQLVLRKARLRDEERTKNETLDHGHILCKRVFNLISRNGLKQLSSIQTVSHSWLWIEKLYVKVKEFRWKSEECRRIHVAKWKAYMENMDTWRFFYRKMKNFCGKVSKFRWKSEEYIWQSKEFIWKQWKNEDLNGKMTNRCEKVRESRWKSKIIYGK